MTELHSHTTASDGMLTPRELITKAHNENIKTIAITDHDTVEGLKEGRKVAEEYNMNFINGIELSCDYKDINKEFHIIGLFIDSKSSELITLINKVTKYREKRNTELLNNLKKINITITDDEIKKTGKTIAHMGKPDFARLITQKGATKNLYEAYKKFLDDENGIIKVKKERIDTSECIKTIHNSNGIAVLAHPFTITKDKNTIISIINELKEQNLDGIEVFYNGYDKKQVKFLKQIARKKGLLMSGGSDFHEEDNQRRSKLAYFGPKKNIPDYIYEEMKDYIKRNRHKL